MASYPDGVIPIEGLLQIYALVKLDKDFTSSPPSEPWESFYARALHDHFAEPAPAGR